MMNKVMFASVLSLSFVYSAYAWFGSENVSVENKDLFDLLSAQASRKDQERLDIWVKMGDIRDSIKLFGDLSAEEVKELVDLHNQAESLSKDIRKLNKQINTLYDPKKRILELEEDEQRITGLIVKALQKQASSTSEGIRKSYEEVTGSQYLNKLEDDLAYTVNEKKRLQDELEKE